MEASITSVLTRFAQPAKCKIQFYQLVLRTYVNQILALVVSKYLLYKIKIQETKENASYHLTDKVEFSYTKITEIKDKAGHYFVKLQCMHEECVTHEETPDLFCEPYIHTGFRPLNRPFTYYLKSLFTMKHNETVNSLSHYMGALVSLVLFIMYCDFNDPYRWPFLTAILTSIFMFLSSATAHLMHQQSHYCHMTCFLFDFTGISLHGFGAALMQSFYTSPTWYYKRIESTLVPTLGVLSALCCLLNCFAQTNYKRPYPPIKRLLQFLPCGLLWLYTIFPTLLAYVTDYGNDMKINFQIHALHIILFLLGALFFALDIPQRFFPGRLDFFGQGHHIFHICIFFVVLFQVKACYSDYITNYELIIATRKEPTLIMCFLSVFAILLYDLFIIKSLTSMIKHNFDDDGNLIKKKTEKIERIDLIAEIDKENNGEIINGDISFDYKSIEENNNDNNDDNNNNNKTNITNFNENIHIECNDIEESIEENCMENEQ